MRTLTAFLLLIATVHADETRTVRVGTVNRTFVVHAPANRPNPAPLVLAFHGTGMSGRTMAWYSGLSSKADKSGFVVAYPNGLNGRFNDASDVAFARAIAENIQPDPKRIFATGMSNGAILCYRLAAEAPELIAAIAPVAGMMPNRDTAKVPLIAFHGTADRYVPYRTAVSSVDAWARAKGCGGTPAMTNLPNTVNDGTSVTRFTYCPDVVLYAVNGGGHTWPGQRTSPGYLGATTFDISANDLMWEFFQGHSK